MSTSLGELAVYLTANSTKFQAGLVHAERSLVNFKNRAFGILGALGVGYTFTAVYKKIIQEYSEQEIATKRLSISLQNQGEQYKKILPYAEAFADEVEKVTRFDNKEILAQMAFASRLGITSAKLKEFTKGAVGLATIIGSDLHRAMLALIRASNGNFTQLLRLGFKIPEVGTQQEKFTVVLKRALEGWEMTHQELDTVNGSMTQLKNIWNDVLRAAGKFVAANPQTIKAISEITSLSANKMDSKVGLFDKLKAYFDYFILQQVNGFGFLTTIVEDWGEAMGAVFEDVKNMISDMIHPFKIFIDSAKEIKTLFTGDSSRNDPGIFSPEPLPGVSTAEKATWNYDPWSANLPGFVDTYKGIGNWIMNWIEKNPTNTPAPGSAMEKYFNDKMENYTDPWERWKENSKNIGNNLDWELRGRKSVYDDPNNIPVTYIKYLKPQMPGEWGRQTTRPEIWNPDKTPKGWEADTVTPIVKAVVDLKNVILYNGIKMKYDSSNKQFIEVEIK